MTKTVEAKVVLPAPPKGYGEPIYGPHPEGQHVRYSDVNRHWWSWDDGAGDWFGWYALPLSKPDPGLARAIEQIAAHVDQYRRALVALWGSEYLGERLTND